MAKKKKKNRKSKVKKLQPLSLREVADAVCKIKSANFLELDKLSAPMVKNQPHLCGTIAGLKLDGVTPEHIGHAWHLLLICYYACGGDKLPMLTMEENISRALKTVAQMILYMDDEKDEKVFKETAMSHPEVNLFAYVMGYLKENNIIGKANSEYHTVLAVNTALQSLYQARKKLFVFKYLTKKRT